MFHFFRIAQHLNQAIRGSHQARLVGAKKKMLNEIFEGGAFSSTATLALANPAARDRRVESFQCKKQLVDELRKITAKYKMERKASYI